MTSMLRSVRSMGVIQPLRAVQILVLKSGLSGGRKTLIGSDNPLGAKRSVLSEKESGLLGGSQGLVI